MSDFDANGVREVPPTDPAGWMNRDAESILLPCAFQPGARVMADGITGTVAGVEFRGLIGTGECRVTYRVRDEAGRDRYVGSDSITAAE